ncbi:hypothetical protein [Nonomuraea sp. NPDC003804]|uniref:hypothetical protein n=1 Tax=Nonomuraea sp. NPDC003804 TaxID=3154547 RepID=UPI0033B4BF5A
MLPLRRVAAGLLIAFFTLSLFGFDILVDPVGWLLVVLGLSSMKAGNDTVFGPAHASAVVAMVLSLAMFVGLGRFLFIGLLHSIAVILTIWFIADGIVKRARAQNDPPTASTFDTLRWVVTVALSAELLSGYVIPGTPWVALAALVAAIWFVVQLYRYADQPYLTPGPRGPVAA